MRINGSIVAYVLIGLNLIAVSTACSQATVAAEWNELALTIAEQEDGLLTLKGVRATAMMHIAMTDALTSIDGRYQPYVFTSNSLDANSIAAAVQAAFTVLADQYPDYLEQLESLRRASLSEVGDASRLKKGLGVGDAAARAVLKNRLNDGWNADVEYKWHPMGPGVYAEFDEHSGTPQGFVFGTGWGQANPLGIERLSDFRVAPPPAIESETYTTAFNEVKEVGRLQSMSRTPDQTHLAFWWKDFAESSHNRLARSLVAQEQLSLVDASRLFALINIAIFDAYVSSFENKFFYNHWRPYTAIRWAENDGNPQTMAEQSWTNTHRHTYAFPSYPSAHGTACGAAMTVLEDVFGDSYAFTMTNRFVDVAGPLSGKIEMSPPTRSFDSFADAAEECGLSRLYLGIHFRYDSTVGVELGRQIGSSLLGRLFQRVRE